MLSVCLWLCSCLCLMCELSRIPACVSDVAKLLPCLATASSHNNYPHHVFFLQSVCKQVVHSHLTLKFITSVCFYSTSAWHSWAKWVSKWDNLLCRMLILMVKLSRTCYGELMPYAGYVLLDSSVMRWLQKQDDDEDRTAAGRELLAAGPQAAKLHCWYCIKTMQARIIKPSPVVSFLSKYTCVEKSLQFSVHNFDKFRHDFVRFVMNHPENSSY